MDERLIPKEEREEIWQVDLAKGDSDDTIARLLDHAAAMDESLAAVRKIIDDEPHTADCLVVNNEGCNCWKSRALAALPAEDAGTTQTNCVSVSADDLKRLRIWGREILGVALAVTPRQQHIIEQFTAALKDVASALPAEEE